jgi:hypothetical protein
MLKPLEQAHTLFLVKKGREKIVRDVLTEMGYDPRVPHPTAPRAETHEKFPQAPAAQYVTGRTPVLTFDSVKEETTSASGIRSGKYSSELKALDSNEMYHVIDYAILMGRKIKIDYSGTPGVRRGVYTVVPESVQRGKDPCLKARVASTGNERQFDVRKISRIGVEPDEQ